MKPLGVIWGKYGEFYNRRNTIMFDDIGRNFLMNPQNGLKVGENLLITMSSSSFPELRNIAVCVRSDPAVHEGPPEQGEGQGAL